MCWSQNERVAARGHRGDYDGLAHACARRETHRGASSQHHTCWWRRAKPIFTASSRPSVEFVFAGALRWSPHPFLAMATLDKHFCCDVRLCLSTSRCAGLLRRVEFQVRHHANKAQIKYNRRRRGHITAPSGRGNGMWRERAGGRTHHGSTCHWSAGSVAASIQDPLP